MPAPRKKRTSIKKKRAARQRRRQPLPAWLLLGGGLLVGIGSVELFDVARDWNWNWTRDAPPAAREEAPAAPELKFDFYTILPSQEMVVPSESAPATAPQTPKPAPEPAGKPSPAPGAYYLQVGSFRKPQEAEAQKARVALLGATASVQRITVGSDQWHRVRIGPYQDMTKLQAVQRRLSKHQIDALLIRARR